MALYRGEENVKALDGREMPLMKVISETLRYIADRAIEKLKDQLGEEIVKKEKVIQKLLINGVQLVQSKSKSL